MTTAEPQTPQDDIERKRFHNTACLDAARKKCNNAYDRGNDDKAQEWLVYIAWCEEQLKELDK